MICNISYTYRKGVGPTVVLLHGWGLDKNAFSKIVNLINPKQSVLTLDFAGFGESDEPKDYYDTYEYTYHIFLFLKKINISEVVLVGHSFGGRISIILSSIFNIKINNLILTSSAGINNFNLIKSLKIIKYKTMKILSKLKLFSYKKLLQCGSDDYKVLSNKMKMIFIRIVNQDLRYLLDKINAKTFLVWDKKDKVTPYSICRCLSNLILDSNILTYQKGGHFTYIKNYKKFSFLINRLL